jgi:cellulose biosynthesis protein BcsQ
MKYVGVNVAADPLFTAAYTGVSGALVLVSADDPGMASSQNEQDNRHYARAAAAPMLEPIDSQDAYDYTLLDCPPMLGAITLNALTAAHLLIIPTQAEYFSAYALRDMMALIRRVRSETNLALAYRILITLLDQRNRTHRTIREQLQQTFGAGLFDTVIEVDTKLRESPIAGTPITQFKPGTRGSLQYRALAQELIEYVQQANTEQAK